MGEFRVWVLCFVRVLIGRATSLLLLNTRLP